MTYKKLYRMLSKTNDEQDAERMSIKQNQMNSKLRDFTKEETFDLMNKAEKETMFGQKMGYAPRMEWLCQEYILHKTEAEFSLVVESSFALVLSADAINLQTKIPLDLRDSLNKKSFIYLDWI